jgi:NB-ARC domain
MDQIFDPGQMHSLDEFIRALRLLKTASGNPSITQITRRIHLMWHQAGRPENELPARSTVGNCFRPGRRRPNPDLLMAVVDVLCHGDPSAIDAWRRALRVVLAETEKATAVQAGRRLPADPGSAIVGRDRVMDQITKSFSGSATRHTIVLRGPAGVGKTALALRLGHRLVDRGLLRGPVLYAQLYGADPENRPADPRAVLGTFLRLLGVTDRRVPVVLEERVAMYRKLLSRTDALIVLDDAAGQDQVSPLLPEGDRAAVIITTRRLDLALDAAEHVNVAPLPISDALTQLRRTVGAERVNSDPAAAEQLVCALSGIPLAIAAIAEHMRAHPHWVVAEYTQPLFALALEGGFRTALAASERQLPGEAKRLLRFLSLLPEPEFDARSAAALGGHSLRATREHLATLAAVQLVVKRPDGDYRIEPIVRAYAWERMLMDEPASQIRRAVRRSGGRRLRRVTTPPTASYPPSVHACLRRGSPPLS